MTKEKKTRGLKFVLDEYVKFRDTANPSLKTVTLDVREATARRALKIKKKEPLVYKGFALVCRGSKLWREENPGVTP